MKHALAFLFLVLSSGLLAQVMPRPEAANPRLQTIDWVEGQKVVLTALPQTGLTVLLQPGEQIRRVSTADQQAMDVRVSSERDSFLVIPARDLTNARILVQTDRRQYEFVVRTASSLVAAYLVRFDYSGPQNSRPDARAISQTAEEWSYRLRGDRSVRPEAIRDDGSQTIVEFGPDQPLPAIFGIGPTGDEEVVNGYMRGGRFVIDRVYRELVFRIDKDKATARRDERAAKSDG